MSFLTVSAHRNVNIYFYCLVVLFDKTKKKIGMSANGLHKITCKWDMTFQTSAYMKTGCLSWYIVWGGPREVGGPCPPNCNFSVLKFGR